MITIYQSRMTVLRLKPELIDSHKHKERKPTTSCVTRHCALQTWTVEDTGFFESCGISGHTVNNLHMALPLGPQWELPCL